MASDDPVRTPRTKVLENGTPEGRPTAWLSLLFGLLLVPALSAGTAGAGNAGDNPGSSGEDRDAGERPHFKYDLRSGGVFTMTNARIGNDVVAFAQRPNGRLRKVGSFATGGSGSGSFEDTANGFVLGTARGEAAPNN